MNFTAIEKEVIFLKAVTGLIDLLINHGMLSLTGKDPDVEVRFHTDIHHKYFNIILLDFLSTSDKKTLGEQTSYLDAIINICKSPNFNENNSKKYLEKYSSEFKEWLEQQVDIEIWLPSISVEKTLSIKRKDFIKICGNYSKHNFTRLSGVVADLIKIFKRNDTDLSSEESLSILDDFFENLHYDILEYHSSTIAEFLNNIRWGIFEYLQPEFKHSLIYDDDKQLRYHFTYPKGINSVFSQTCYWDLMNWIRSKPIMNLFKVTSYLKKRY